MIAGYKEAPPVMIAGLQLDEGYNPSYTCIRVEPIGIFLLIPFTTGRGLPCRNLRFKKKHPASQ